jgi:hypothetical protein
MKSFQFVTLFSLIAAAMAFAPAQVSKGEFVDLLFWRQEVTFSQQRHILAS